MASSPSSVKTRILIMSDTHEGFQQHLPGSRHDPWSEEGGSFRPPLPKADVLVHSGDLTMLGTMDQYRGALRMLASVDAELKLVIAGNHDLSLHYDYYKTDPHARQIAKCSYDAAFAEQARDLWEGEEAKKAGVTYLTEGMYTFSLSNGATFTVYASPWQPVFYDWAFNYPLTEDRWNPPHLVRGAGVVPAKDARPIPAGAEVDVVITHGPPRGHLDMTVSGIEAGCPHLLRMLERVRPRLHCFGHIHEAWGAEVISWNGNGDDGTGSMGEKGEVFGALGSGGEGRQTPLDEDVVRRRANYLDMSETSGRPLEIDNETLLVNSCIMDLKYDAKGSAWLVDIDLPVKKQE